MKLEITVKQKEERVIALDGVKSYYFDKHYLVIRDDSDKKSWYKTTTVLSIEEK